MLSVVLTTIVLFAILMFANRLLFKKRGRIPPTRWVEAAGLSFLVGIVNYASPKLIGSPGAIFCLLGILAAYLWLCFSWRGEGSEWKEFAPYAIVALIMYLTAESAAWAVAPMVASLGWKSFLTFLPEVAMIGSIAYMAWRLLDFHHERFLKMEDERRANRYRIAKIVILVIAILLLIAMAASALNFDFGEEEQAIEEEATDGVEVPDKNIEVTWYRFYHYDLLGDSNIDNDFNFGLPAYPDGTAMQAKEEHFKRVEEDPALGCATFATFDVRLGTDFLIPGQHYDQNWSDGYWTTLINERIQYYMANSSDYAVAVERWEAFVNKYANVTLNYQTALTDQMYMVSLTSLSELEAPEVIVAYTNQPDGHILGYEFKIKGNLFVVPFRTECGLQPVNVAAVMKETPQANPVKKTSSSSKPAASSSSGGSSSSSGSGSSSSTVSGSGSSSSTVSNSGSNIRDRKDPVGDPVNNGNADKGGGQNRPTDGPGEVQNTDPRTENPTGSQNDNNHGHSDPATVTPSPPPVVESHQEEEKQDQIVDHEKPIDYKPDPVTGRGARDGTDPTPVAGGAGGFTPDDD